MRTKVAFSFDARFVADSESDGRVLAVRGATWFVKILSRIDGAEFGGEPIQEDWGVVVPLSRERCKFWIGLSYMNRKGQWFAHVHHDDFAWLQSWSTRGNRARDALVVDFASALEVGGARRMRWFYEKDGALKMPAPRPDV